MYLTKSQAEIAKDTHRFRVLRCGRRFGKTALAVEEIKGVALARESRIVYIAPTIQQARDIAWLLLKKELKAIIVKSKEAPSLELEVRNLKGTTSLIQLRGWEAIETLRGQAFDFIVLDEVASMRNFWVNWEEVIRPTLTDRQGSVLFASTPKGYNHFFDLCNKELTDKDFKSFHFTSYDNPHLNPEELETAKNSLIEERFSQEYLAEFTKTSGLVYREFNRLKHLYEVLPTKTNYKFYGALDFGYRNPAALLDAYFDGENLFVEDEWYKRERTDSQIAEYASLKHYEAIYPDPENAGGIEELHRKRINVREVVKGKGSIQSGIQMVREMLKRGNLKINKKCVNLISEFEMYSYDDDKTERNEQENPIKANDHALDALRYLVSSLLPIVQRREMSLAFPRIPQPKKNNPAR